MTNYERAFEEDRYKTLRFADYNGDWLDFVVLNRDPAFTTNRHDYNLLLHLEFFATVKKDRYEICLLCGKDFRIHHCGIDCRLRR